jgi:hypothetical protein
MDCRYPDRSNRMAGQPGSTQGITHSTTSCRCVQVLLSSRTDFCAASNEACTSSVALLASTDCRAAANIESYANIGMARKPCPAEGNRFQQFLAKSPPGLAPTRTDHHIPTTLPPPWTSRSNHDRSSVCRLPPSRSPPISLAHGT